MNLILKLEMNWPPSTSRRSHGWHDHRQTSRKPRAAVRQPMLFLACQLDRRHGMSPTTLGLEQSDGDWGECGCSQRPFTRLEQACQPRTAFSQAKSSRDLRPVRVEDTDAEVFLASPVTMRGNVPMTPSVNHHESSTKSTSKTRCLQVLIRTPDFERWRRRRLA